MKIVAWWYHLTTPRSEDRTLPQREKQRYARLISIFSLVLGIITILSLPGTITLGESLIYIDNLDSLISVILIVATILLNRQGWLSLAGISCVGCGMIAILMPVLEGPLDTARLPLFAALVIPVVLAGSVLPPVWALIVALINSVLIALVITFMPATAALTLVLRESAFTIIITLVAVQIVVAVVIFSIMHNLLTAIRRADRAEEVIELQAALADQARKLAQVNTNLEEGIYHIAQTHAAIANGELDARVSLSDDNVLWSVAVPLNNLLNRTKSWKQELDHHKATQNHIHQLTIDLQKTRMHPFTPLKLRRTGTYLDPLLQEVTYLHTQAKNPPSNISS